MCQTLPNQNVHKEGLVESTDKTNLYPQIVREVIKHYATNTHKHTDAILFRFSLFVPDTLKLCAFCQSVLWKEWKGKKKQVLQLQDACLFCYLFGTLLQSLLPVFWK